MTEAEKVSELHQEVKNGLVNDDVEKVKNWQKEAYHKQMIGGFKEAKEAEEGFKKAQKPWAKKLKEVSIFILGVVEQVVLTSWMEDISEPQLLFTELDSEFQLIVSLSDLKLCCGSLSQLS